MIRLFLVAATIFAGAVQTIHADTSYKGLGAESLSPETVKKFAPPALPREISAKLQAMLDLRAPGSGIMSDDGKHLFLTWRVTGNSQVFRMDRPLGFPQQLTGGEDSTSIMDVSTDGKMLIISRDRGGEENPGLFWQDSSGGPLHLIQQKPKVQTEYDFISDDSQRIYFHANDIKPDSYALYRYDVKSGKIDKIFSQDGLWYIADRRDEKTFLLGKDVGSMRTEFYLWKVGDEKLEHVVGKGENEEYRVRFSSKPGEYIVLTSKFGDFRRLYRMKDGKFTAISPDIKWDISGFKIDKDHRHIVYEVNEAGYTKLSAIDGQTFKPVSIPAVKGAEQIFMGEMSRNGRYFSMSTSSAQTPFVTHVFDWQSRKFTAWTPPIAPEVDLKSFAPVTLESYPAADGTKIPVFVRRPKQCENKLCPVIVDFHGGPEGQAVPYFTAIMQAFVDEGFILLEPNVRGSDGYGKAWVNADNGPKRLNIITDIRDAATYARKAFAVGGVEPKVGVFGGSYGGYSVQIAMTMFAGSYDAGVSVVGISNLLTFLQNTAPYRRILRMNEYGDPDKDREALIKLSPTTYVDRAKAPMLIIQGLNDPRVPAGEAVQMYESFQKRKIPAKLVIFPDEGHGSSKRENQVKQFGYALEFFKEHLKPAVDTVQK